MSFRVGDLVMHQGRKFAGWVFLLEHGNEYQLGDTLFVTNKEGCCLGDLPGAVFTSAHEAAWRKVTPEEEAVWRLTGVLPPWRSRP